jgi:hypothetical protein
MPVGLSARATAPANSADVRCAGVRAPANRSATTKKQVTWQDLLTPEVARRLGVASGAADPRPRALVAAALACLNAAVDIWIAADGAVGLPTLFDQAMSALA